MSTLELVRTTREQLLRLVSPIDAAWNRAWGRPPLPPLWLRRHTGPVKDFIPAAREMATWIDRLTPIRESAVVLDIGCGCGAMVGSFQERLGPQGQYVGFDVHEPSITWCRENLAQPRFSFEFADVDSPYSLKPSRSACAYRFPLGDRRADLVLAKSVFTHLREDDFRHYLTEIRRVLVVPTGRALISAFLFESDTTSPIFPWSAPDGLSRWRFRRRPEAAIAWKREAVFSWCEAAGLEVDGFAQIFWPGTQRVLKGQDLLILSSRS